MAGRPTTFSAEVAAQIIARISEGRSVRVACLAVGCAKSTFDNWVLADRGGIQEPYRRALVIRGLLLLDQIGEIADDSRRDYVPGPNGPVFDHAHLRRCEARIAFRLRYAERHVPAHLGGGVRGGGQGEFKIVCA